MTRLKTSGAGLNFWAVRVVGGRAANGRSQRLARRKAAGFLPVAAGRLPALAAGFALAVAAGIGGVAQAAGTQSTASWWEPENDNASGILLSKDIAQSFSTGPCVAGYKLTVLSIKFRTPSGTGPPDDRLRLTLHEATGEKPGDLLGTFPTNARRVGTRTYDDGTQNTYMLWSPPNTTLQPHTTYFLALHDPQVKDDHAAVSTAVASYTASNDQARTVNDTGWRIGNNSLIRDRSGDAITSATTSRTTWSGNNDSVRVFVGFNPKDRSCRGWESFAYSFNRIVREVPAEWGGIPKDGSNDPIFGPGESFRLFFVTSGTSNAQSQHIADYNRHVQYWARNGWSPIRDYADDFRVVGSTEAVDARDITFTRYTNSDKGVPIYWVNGTKVADDYEDFYDGSWDNRNPGRQSNGDQKTFTVHDYVFTGSFRDGTKFDSGFSNTAPLGGGSGLYLGEAIVAEPKIGRVIGPSSVGSFTTELTSNTHPFYGLSPIFRVADGSQQATGLPVLSVTNAAVMESGNGETSTMTFAVGVDPSPDQAITVAYETEDGTATGGEACPAVPGGPDYVTTSGALRFQPGDTAMNVEVTVCDDTVLDSGEEFYLKVTSPQLAPPGGDAPEVRGTGVIMNTETTTEVSMVAGPAYVEEGAEAVFTLTRAGDAEASLTVPVTVTEDGAVLGTPVPASVTFAAGARVAELRVPTDDDEADEPDGTVTATVAAGFAWRLAAGADAVSAAVTVLDNDAPAVRPAAGVALWAADMQVVDYETGSIGAATADLFSNVRGTAGLAAKWLFYDAPRRELRLAFTAGMPEVAGMTLHLDGVVLALPAGSGGSSSATWTDVDIDWSDGDTLAVRLVKPSDNPVSNDATLASLAVADATLAPAFEAGVAVYTATVDRSTETVTVTAQANDGGATVAIGPAADADAEQAHHQVTLASGETLFTVTVTAQDGATQRDYRVVVSRARAPVAVSFGASQYTAAEGGKPAAVAVSLDADPQVAVTVPLVATPEGGAAAEDFEAPLTLTFERGAGLTQTVTVKAVEDASAEDGERVTLAFGTLPKGIVAGNNASTAIALVDAKPNTPATGAPSIDGTPRVSETLSAGSGDIADEDGLDDAAYSYRWVSNDGDADTDIGDATGASYTLTDAEQGDTVKVRVTFTDDAGHEETLVSAATVEVAARPNRPATGAPSIDGTPRVDETLSAGSGDIADEDGLDDVSYAYRWVSNDGDADTDIGDATGASYTLTDAEQGDTVKVRVTFTDDAGHEETLVSAATVEVAARSGALTASFEGVPAAHQGTGEEFTFQLVFSEAVKTGYAALRDEALSATDGTVTRARRVNGQSDRWEITVKPSSDGAVTVTLGADIACGEPGAVCTAQDVALPQAVSVTVNGPDDEGETVSANTPATGAPSIAGTPRVGETLSAGIGDIADEDGLDNVAYAYRWVSNDGDANTDIAGATGASYDADRRREGRYGQGAGDVHRRCGS